MKVKTNTESPDNASVGRTSGLWINFVSLVICVTGILLMNFRPVQAQDSFFNRFDFGAGITYGTMNYESYGGSLNENLSYDTGFKLHLHYNHPVSEKAIVLTGLEYVFFTYKFKDDFINQTDENGDPTGSYTKLSMMEEFSTTHLSLPIRVKYHPLPDEYRVYITAGSELFYKIGYQNGTVENQSFSENDEPQTRRYFSEYTIPETANDFMATGTAGVGYSFNPAFPLTLEMRFTQSLTPYRSGKGIINSYMQEFTISFSYRL